MIKLSELLDEKHLTPAEIAKKEEIVKALKKSGMKQSPKMYAIATAKAEKVAEVLDKVGQEDADINNDGKTDKTDKYLANRRKAIAANIDETHLNWPPTQDHEATMAKGELRDMIENAITIYKLIEPNQQIPGWVSAYITLASDYIDSVAGYLVEEEATIGQEI